MPRTLLFSQVSLEEEGVHEVRQEVAGRHGQEGDRERPRQDEEVLQGHPDRLLLAGTNQTLCFSHSGVVFATVLRIFAPFYRGDSVENSRRFEICRLRYYREMMKLHLMPCAWHPDTLVFDDSTCCLPSDDADCESCRHIM